MKHDRIRIKYEKYNVDTREWTTFYSRAFADTEYNRRVYSHAALADNGKFLAFVNEDEM
jgi:hypothetical protein